MGPVARRDRLREGRVAVRARKAPLHRQRNALAEEGDLDADNEASLTPDLAAAWRFFAVGEAEVELDRDRDEAQHLQQSAAAQISGEGDAGASQPEIDAGHDEDAAGGDD